MCGIYIFKVAVVTIQKTALDDIFLQCLVEIILVGLVAIWSVAHEPMQQHYWVVIAPGRLGSMPILTTEKFKMLVFIELADNFLNEVDHKHKHDDISIILEDIESPLHVLWSFQIGLARFVREILA